MVFDGKMINLFSSTTIHSAEHRTASKTYFIINIGVVAQPGIRLSEIIKNMQAIM